jgi:hypothetical protein
MITVPHIEIERRRRLGRMIQAVRRLCVPAVSRRVLAERAGLSFDRVRNLEWGEAKPRRAEIDALCRALPMLGEALKKQNRPRVLGEPFIPQKPPASTSEPTT